jgi:hypothetical protein
LLLLLVVLLLLELGLLQPLLPLPFPGHPPLLLLLLLLELDACQTKQAPTPRHFP